MSSQTYAYDTLHMGRSSIDLYGNEIGAPFKGIKSFGAGFLLGHIHGRGWYKSARLGNACGAIVVTRHGYANFMQTILEVTDFVDGRGGF